MNHWSVVFLFIMMNATKAQALDEVAPLFNSERMRYALYTTTELQCVANPRPLAGMGRDIAMEWALEDSKEPENKRKNPSAAIILQTFRMVEASAPAD